MTAPDRKSSPLVRFLGEDAGRGGPFALLGLTHDIRSDTEVHRARARRLRQVDCHPQRSTPDAEEVRLAVHSAATQLLDPSLREQLVLRWPEGTPVDLPKAWNPSRAMQRITPALIRRARMIVGSSGGWNNTARRRLAHLARLNHISAIEVIQQLGASGKRRSQARASDRVRAPIPNLPGEPSGGLGWVPAYITLGLLASTLVATILIAPLRPLAPVPAVTQATDTDASYLDAPSPSPAGNTVQRDQLTHYTAIAHELDRLVARARVEPEPAIERFREVYGQFTRGWLSFPPPALQRAGANIAEFVTRLDEHQLPPEQIAPLLAVAGSAPDRVMISSGMIDVTLASSALRAETRDQLREIRARMSNAPITPGTELRACAYSVATELARTETGDDPAWWEPWLAGAMQASESETERTGIVLVALNSGLRAPPPPGEEWRQTVAMLVGALDWRAESAERYWLLSQFGDAEVSTSRLAMLTEALVTESSAPGVDQLMVLSRTANDPKREQIGARYRESWFPQQASDPSETPSASPLIREMQIECSSMPDSINDDQAIERTLTLTRLSSAAYLALEGHDALSEELLLNPLELPDLPKPQDINMRYSPDDDEWGQRAVNCDEAAELRPLLDELVGRDSIGISSAHALVYLASRRAQSDVRELALTQVVRYSDQIEVLIAIDHALSRSRTTSRVESLVSEVLEIELPSRNDNDWYLRARRALLTRMGQAMAREQDLRVSRLQRELARWHAMRIDLRDLEPIDPQRPAMLLDQINQFARSDLDSLVSRSPSLGREREEVDSSALVRIARAESQVQLYHAHQLRQLGYLRLQLRAQFPDTDRLIDSITREHVARDAAAGTALQQIAQAQRAIAQLLQIAIERGGVQ